MNIQKVVIIGAGVAGMSAAKRLIEIGINPLILEKKSIPGGRAFSFKDEKSGEIINNGEHVMIGAYHNFFELLKFIGSYDLLESQKALRTDYYDDKQKLYSLDTGLAPGKLGKLLGFINFKALKFSEKIKAVLFINKIPKLKGKCESLSALDILLKYNQNTNLINILWEPLILATMNAYPKEASAELFLQVADVLFNGTTFDAKIFFPKLNLSALFEQFENIISRKGSSILYNTGVEEIIKLENATFELKLNTGKSIITENIISCVPPFVLKKIYKDLSLNEFYENVTYSTIISAYLWFDKKLSDKKFIGLLNSKIHWIFRKRDENELGNYPERIAVTISAASNLDYISREEITRLVVDEIKNNVPGASYADLLHSKLLVDKRATIQIDSKCQSLRPDQFMEKGFYIAGDWTKTGLPATLEGAALSGVLAVNKLMLDIK